MTPQGPSQCSFIFFPPLNMRLQLGATWVLILNSSNVAAWSVSQSFELQCCAQLPLRDSTVKLAIMNMQHQVRLEIKLKKHLTYFDFFLRDVCSLFQYPNYLFPWRILLRVTLHAGLRNLFDIALHPSHLFILNEPFLLNYAWGLLSGVVTS